MSEQKTFVPPKKTFTVEFIVGLFCLIGTAAFAYLAVNIAGMRLFDSGSYQLLAEFDNISGLELGAPVEIAGVPVGQVVSIDLKETTARVTLSVQDSVAIRSDDIASIRTKGIIGDRYIKIGPGSSEERVQDGGVLTDTESTVDLEDIIGKLIHRMD